jgi:hypothetical protein
MTCTLHANSGQLIAGATLALVVVTAWYAMKTRDLARTSASAAQSAQMSAASAERSAQAAERAMAIGLASFGQGFEVTYNVHRIADEDGPFWDTWGELRSSAARIFVHEVALTSIRTEDTDGILERRRYPKEARPVLFTSVPARELGRGEPLQFNWAGPGVDLDESDMDATVTISYSLAESDDVLFDSVEVRPIRRAEPRLDA